MDRYLQLSTHFKLEDFIVQEIEGQPNFDPHLWEYCRSLSLPKQTIILNNLKRLARRLELVQTNIGHPLVIKKGLSIPHLDEMEELHASGQAVDLYCNSAEQQKARLDEDWNGGYGQAENWCHLDISPNLERWET